MLEWNSTLYCSAFLIHVYKFYDLWFVSCFSHINKKTTYTDPRLTFAEDEKKTPFDFKQKFDGNSTALQVVQGQDLSGKYAIVTGANSGIGKFGVYISGFPLMNTNTWSYLLSSQDDNFESVAHKCFFKSG